MTSKSLSYLIGIFVFIATMTPISAFAADDADLPPRPIPPSGPQSEPKTSHDAGAKISLHAAADDTVDASTWTQVQWLDEDGRWREVNGWRGTFYFNDEVDKWEVEWWIGRPQLGDGPFRWVIEAENGDFYTQEFYLPARSMMSEIIEIGLENRDVR